ncbi:MAG: hypothetical protein AB7J46_02865 [Candidatus Altimarinota bacterium]
MRSIVLTLLMLAMTWSIGCVSQPDRPPSPPIPPVAGGTTINAPTVVNPPPGGGQQLGLQVTRDPNNPNRGWVLLGNQPVPVRLEGGAWMFDIDLSRFQTPAQPPQPLPQPGPQPAPAPPPSTLKSSQFQVPPGYMSPALAQELLLIDKIELYRVLLERMKQLATNAQISSVDEFNLVINRLESLIREMERLQSLQAPPPQQNVPGVREAQGRPARKRVGLLVMISFTKMIRIPGLYTKG